MDINKEFEKLAEEFEKEWHDGHEPQGIDDQYVEEMEDKEVEEARAYKNKQDDDEKKKKKPFAFGGKKKSRHGSSGYGKGEEVDRHAKVMAKRGDSAKAIKKMHPEISDDELKDLLGEEEVEKQTNLKEKIMDLEDVIKKIIGETNKNDKSDDGDGLDAVQPKAVKKKFKDRKDKDIDNDGDTDDSDKFLHKKRKAISKAISKEEVSEAYWKVSIPDMTPIFVETGSKSDIMKDMRKKLKPDALKGLEIERVSKSAMIKMYRELAKGGGEEEEPKKEETTMSKMFSHVKNTMKEKKKKMLKGYTSKY